MPELLQPLRDKRFRWLFFSQLISLTGTGLATVALALLAYDLSPTSAGAVLGTALAVKMVAYLTIAPVVGSYASLLPRKYWLAGLSLARAGVVACLPFIAEAWQLYLLIFLLNALAAGYTPVYQALLPDILPEEQSYNQALSLSRLATEMEALLSPALAAALLLLLPYDLLFTFNSIAFVIAAAFIGLVTLPIAQTTERSGGVWHRISFGVRSYLKTPRLRGVLALNLALSLAGAMVIVNTVVYVREVLGLSEEAVPLLMMATGVGSIAAALLLPALMRRFSDRNLMLSGALLFPLSLLLGAAPHSYVSLFPLWAVIGFATSLVLIPTGKVIRDSCQAGDRNDFFAANFALTHGMWLIGYLLAGQLGAQLGLTETFVMLAAMAAVAILIASQQWAKAEPEAIWHEHQALEHTHPHIHDAHHQHAHEGWEGPEPHTHMHHHATVKHKHPFTIDEHHVHWPKEQ